MLKLKGTIAGLLIGVGVLVGGALVFLSGIGQARINQLSRPWELRVGQHPLLDGHHIDAGWACYVGRSDQRWLGIWESGGNDRPND